MGGRVRRRIVVLRSEGFLEEALPNIFVAERSYRVGDGCLRVVSDQHMQLVSYWSPASSTLTYLPYPLTFCRISEYAACLDQLRVALADSSIRASA
jgi:hypothetical protein